MVGRDHSRWCCEALVQHAVEPLHLVGVALDRVGDLFGRVEAEVVGLAEHRADAAHLEHQPLAARVAAARVGSGRKRPVFSAR